MMYLTLVLAVVVTQAINSNAVGLVPTCLTGKLLQMESCPNDGGTYKMGYENITIDKVGEGKYLASGMVEVKETVEGPVNISMVVHKCEEKFNQGTCTVYTKWTSDGCKEMTEKKGTLYKMITNAGGEAQVCPLQPKKYFMKDYEIKIPDEAAATVAVAGNTWFVSIHGTAKDDEVVLCTNVWLEIVSCDEPKRKYNKFGR